MIYFNILLYYIYIYIFFLFNLYFFTLRLSIITLPPILEDDLSKILAFLVVFEKKSHPRLEHWIF